MYRPCLHCENSRYDPEECPLICTYGELRKKYEDEEVNQETRLNVLERLFCGEWVDTSEVEKALDLSFADGLKLFDFSRTAEWWSLAGTTEEERKRNGQKIATSFRVKEIARLKEKLEALLHRYEMAAGERDAVQKAYIDRCIAEQKEKNNEKV